MVRIHEVDAMAVGTSWRFGIEEEIMESIVLVKSVGLGAIYPCWIVCNDIYGFTI